MGVLERETQDVPMKPDEIMDRAVGAHIDSTRHLINMAAAQGPNSFYQYFKSDVCSLGTYGGMDSDLFYSAFH